MVILATVAVGSNLQDGDKSVKDIVVQSIEVLSKYQSVEVVKVAPVIITKPVEITVVEGEDVNDFLNTAVLIKFTPTASQTCDGPHQLLHLLHEIEQYFHRFRSLEPTIKLSRTLDLDIITYGDYTLSTGQIYQTHDLIIPHPRAQERDFVMIPFRQLYVNS